MAAISFTPGQLQVLITACAEWLRAPNSEERDLLIDEALAHTGLTVQAIRSAPDSTQPVAVFTDSSVRVDTTITDHVEIEFAEGNGYIDVYPAQDRVEFETSGLFTLE